jgi:hypothetical protein
MMGKNIIIAGMFLLVSILACQSISLRKMDFPTPAESYAGLRNAWFTVPPESLGLSMEHDTVPSANDIKFSLITPSGIYPADEANSDLLASGKHELSPLFLAGDDAITVFPKASEGTS